MNLLAHDFVRHTNPGPSVSHDVVQSSATVVDLKTMPSPVCMSFNIPEPFVLSSELPIPPIIKAFVAK